MEDGGGNRVEFTGDGAAPVASRFEWDRPSTCERVKDARRVPGIGSQRGQPMEAADDLLIRRHGEGPVVPVPTTFEPDPGCIRLCNGGAALDWVTEDAERPNEPGMVLGLAAWELDLQPGEHLGGSRIACRLGLGRPCGKQRGDHRGPARRERTPRPPYVQAAVRRLLGRARVPQTFSTDRGRGQPLLNEAPGHRRPPPSSSVRKARRPRGRCALACQ
jgi:hypothetical protein